MRSAQQPIRIGVLGAAHIVKGALLRPSRDVQGVTIAAIAARDPQRARAYAAKNGIPRVHESYASLLRDPDLDAVYIPLPAAYHAQWTLAAIEAGKHVLCEKPFAANAIAAAQVATAAEASGVIVMEAYHSHYHPLRSRLRDILASGELGDIRAASATACAPIPPGRDIRWSFELGGGGLLDIGYYPLRLLRDLFGEATVVEVRARTKNQIDNRLSARLLHDSGVSTTLLSGMWTLPLLSMRLDVQGSRARMRVGSPYHPQLGGTIRIEGADGRRIERPDRRSSYEYQLEGFVRAVHSRVVETGPRQAVRQMEAIDALYTAAGLPVRPSKDSG